jgi:hypothetical protein
MEFPAWGDQNAFFATPEIFMIRTNGTDLIRLTHDIWGGATNFWGDITVDQVSDAGFTPECPGPKNVTAVDQPACPYLRHVQKCHASMLRDASPPEFA